MFNYIQQHIHYSVPFVADHATSNVCWSPASATPRKCAPCRSRRRRRLHLLLLQNLPRRTRTRSQRHAFATWSARLQSLTTRYTRTPRSASRSSCSSLRRTTRRPLSASAARQSATLPPLLH